MLLSADIVNRYVIVEVALKYVFFSDFLSKVNSRCISYKIWGKEKICSKERRKTYDQTPLSMSLSLSVISPQH